jgi:coenzyme F420-reducing hydrogenase delta subunit
MIAEKNHPEICMFFCSNCLDSNQVDSYCKQLGVDKRLAISLPCSGKVNIQYLIKAFETGADGVALLTCEINECHHLEGNKRAKKRVQAIDSLLNEIGLGTGRIAVFEVKQNEQEKTKVLIRDFFEKVRRIHAEKHAEVVT